MTVDAGDGTPVDVGDEALDLLDLKEVAKRLKMSVHSVRRKIDSGELEAVRPNRRVLVAPEAIIDYKRKLREAGQAAAAAARGTTAA